MKPSPCLRLTEIKLPLDHAPEALNAVVMERLKLQAYEIVSISIVRRGFDARKKSDIHFIYTLDVQTADNAGVLARAQRMPKLATHIGETPDTSYQFVTRATDRSFKRPVVIGTGPCGLFAALTLAQMGFKPIVLERGKAVRERTKDTWAFWRKSQLQAESNVQFGEGGAGTFSDGKLWSQVKDPLFHGRKVLEDMVRAGAPDEIMYVSKPHVGTFRLVKVVEFLREEICALGGEFRFSSKVTDILLEKSAIKPVETAQAAIKGVVLEDGTQIDADHVVLAIGHSARDTFEMLHAKGVYVEAKPFSVGFRIEHPQGLIDRARFGPFAGNDMLGAADYKLVHHADNGRSVYSFCMCPGGTVVAAASEPYRVVTNGMSQYSRNERNANAGIVVGVTPADYPDHVAKPLAGFAFQRTLESHAYTLGGSNYHAPGQLVGDFVTGKPSTQLGSVEPSYQPGVLLGDLHSALPAYAIAAMREALPVFGKKIRGFDMHDAVLTGVETRTSSPVKITRGDNFQSLNVKGLYPAGEGASYAGGILSAGVDGIEVAEAVARNICDQPARKTWPR